MYITASIDFSSFFLFAYLHIRTCYTIHVTMCVYNEHTVAGQLAETLRTTQQFSIYFAPMDKHSQQQPHAPVNCIYTIN